MKARDWAWPVIIIVAVLAAAGWYFFGKSKTATPETPVAVAPPPVTEAAASAADAAPQYPVPDADTAAAEQAETAPLPALADSDQELRQALIGLLDAAPIEAFLVPQDIIRRFVATVDNLPEPTLPMRLRSVRKIGGGFTVQPQGDEALSIGAGNSARYAGFIEAVQLADARRSAQIYFRYYPLFQAAYEELGHRGRYFNDRLVQVIDHLLATPDVGGPIALQRSRGMYEFADPELESRSAGQKALIRIGSENAEVVKAKLRLLRAEIVKHRAGESLPR